MPALGGGHAGELIRDEHRVKPASFLLLEIIKRRKCPLPQNQDDHDVDGRLNAHEDIGQVPCER